MHKQRTGPAVAGEAGTGDLLGSDRSQVNAAGTAAAMGPMLDAALLIGRAGFRVLPIRADNRIPHIRGWQHQASREPAEITRWWRIWPDALIGGLVPPALLIVDVDPRNGGSIEELERACGVTIPPTLTVWSGRGDGGQHLYFKRPGDGDDFRSKLSQLPGIDIKTSGFVMLPPSLHPVTGRPYGWESPRGATDRIAALPPQLRELLRRPVIEHSNAEAVSSRQMAGILRKLLSANEGNRNDLLHWAACRAVEYGVLDALSERLTWIAAQLGLDDDAVAATINSAKNTVSR